MSSLTLNSFVDTFASPNAVFDRIREKTISSWAPFILVLLATLGVMTWYFMTIDMYAFMETSMAVSGREVPQADFEKMMSNESVMRIGSSATIAITFGVMYLVLALFFFLAATLVAEEKYTFGQFFALICWASLPGLLSTISMGISYMAASDFVYLSFLDKTSLSSILGMTIESANYDVATAITAGTVWSYALYGVGFARITRCSAVTATIIGIIPPALHYGLTYIL